MVEKTRLKKNREVRGGTIAAGVLNNEIWNELEKVQGFYDTENLIAELQDFEKDFSKEQINKLIDYASKKLSPKLTTEEKKKLLSQYKVKNRPHSFENYGKDYEGRYWSYKDVSLSKEEQEKLAAAPYYQLLMKINSNGSPPSSLPSSPRNSGSKKYKKKKYKIKSKKSKRKSKKSKRKHKKKSKKTKRK